MSRPYYLVVWSSGREISEQEAYEEYAAFTADSAARIFSEPVYLFYCELLRHYPDVEMTAEEDLPWNPWACAVEFAEDHVVLPLLQEHHAASSPFILRLATLHRLVCYDPQTQKVYLPSHELRNSSNMTLAP